MEGGKVLHSLQEWNEIYSVIPLMMPHNSHIPVLWRLAGPVEALPAASDLFDYPANEISFIYTVHLENCVWQWWSWEDLDTENQCYYSGLFNFLTYNFSNPDNIDIEDYKYHRIGLLRFIIRDSFPFCGSWVWSCWKDQESGSRIINSHDNYDRIPNAIVKSK